MTCDVSTGCGNVLVLHGSLNRRMAGFLHILTHLFGEEKLCHSVNLWQQFFCQSISGYVFFNKTKKWQLLHCTNIGFLFRWYNTSHNKVDNTLQMVYQGNCRNNDSDNITTTTIITTIIITTKKTWVFLFRWSIRATARRPDESWLLTSKIQLLGRISLHAKIQQKRNILVE